MARTRRGFTLIELLVVFAIIGALLAILMPVLASARSAAIGSNCLSNQRQLTIAVTAYALENKGRIPYGPVEANGGVLSGVDDLYIINGMTTSLVSDKFGRVIGAGLMLDNYLQQTPEILFCPGSDQSIAARDELNLVGTGTAISGYYYRHGSNTADDLDAYRGSGTPMDTRTRLDNLGQNRNGDKARALFMDNNFVLPQGSSFAELFHRSNHERAYVNVVYVDGHAEQRDNRDGRYEVGIVGTNLYSAIDKMVKIFEEADLPH